MIEGAYAYSSWILKFSVSLRISSIKVMCLELARQSAFVCSFRFELWQVYVLKQVNNDVVKQVRFSRQIMCAEHLKTFWIWKNWI